MDIKKPEHANKGRNLKINGHMEVGTNNQEEYDGGASYAADGEVFVKGDVAITSTGVAMKNKVKLFTVVAEELEKGEKIGRGCSSVVWKSRHIPTGTPLALKVVNMYDKGKREQLIREIQALYDAQCPALVTFYGAFYRDAAVTIALEYMDGGSLENVISQVGAIPEKPLANMAYQILFGLSYLKHQKRVHRDVKPGNVLLNSSGEVKLTDFGIAAELHSSIAMCATFVGTFKYMSPERVRKEKYDFSSDIWSIGLVILECATGTYPYPAQKTCIDMIQTLVDTPPPVPSPEHFSSEFCRFIESCLRKAPSDRLPADILLGSPWLQKNGATSIESARNNIREWIQSL